MVNHYFWIKYRREQVGEIRFVAENVNLSNNGRTPHATSIRHALEIISRRSGHIVNDQSNHFAPNSILRREPSRLEFSVASPQFAVHRHGRKFGNKIHRSRNHIAAARPELRAVPKRAAAVEFLCGKPARNFLAFPVAAQRHLFFIHAKTIAA